MNRQRLYSIFNYVSHYKYLIVTTLGILFVGFIGENSYRNKIMLELKVSDLKDEIKYYRERNENDTKQLQDIRRDQKLIEKIARERYFMKAEDEDIFILSTDMDKTEDEKK